MKTPLPSEDHKTYREYEALAMLKYLLPEQFANLHKAEAPDLQDTEHSLGVEVTYGGSQEDELISGESIKYSQARTDKERERIREKIQQHDGDRDDISTSYPVGTSEKDKANIQRIFRKKLKKAENYRKKFRHLGIVIIIDIPLFYQYGQIWGKWLSALNDSSVCKYEFVVLSHWGGIDIYNFKTKQYLNRGISQEDRDALKKLARMTTEGIIKDDDCVWR